MFKKNQFYFFLGLFAAIRIFSYFFSPPTPLLSGHWLNSAISIFLLLLTALLFIRGSDRAYLIVAAEFILGGAGGYLSIYGFSLRSALLVLTIIAYLYQIFSDRRVAEPNKFILPILLLTGWAAVAAFRGLQNGHDLHQTIADFVPYLFLFYFLPLLELWRQEKSRTWIVNLLAAAVVGNFIFIFLSFAGFSAGYFDLQGNFYHWYRDVALGKITDLGGHFFRLILNEQLLLVPLLLLFWHKFFHGQNKLSGYLAVLLLIMLTVNLTRIYFLALLVGYLCLLDKAYWKNQLLFGLALLLIFFTSFTAIHFSASRGQSFGWELLGLRLGSVAAPEIEDSSFSRMLLLPKIWEKIKTAPILGHGLGDTVTVFSPVYQDLVTTPNFDWGYLEIWDELGLIGLLTCNQKSLAFRGGPRHACDTIGYQYYFAGCLSCSGNNFDYCSGSRTKTVGCSKFINAL